MHIPGYPQECSAEERQCDNNTLTMLLLDTDVCGKGVAGVWGGGVGGGGQGNGGGVPAVDPCN